MTMKKMAAVCAAATMMATMGAANAQMNGATPMTAPPGAMMPGGSMPGGSMMAPGSSMTTSQTTQSVTSGSAVDDYAADNSTLPNTGGEPLLMMMAGTLLAGSAFALRRKLS